MTHQIASIISQIPGCVFWKDCHSVYLGGNQEFADVIGLNPNDLIGKTDDDMPWAKTHAKIYRQRDREVIAARTKLTFFETQIQQENKWVTVHVNKAPLVNAQGQLIGVIGNYTYQPQPKQFIDHLAKICLTTSQTDCLIHVASGKTAKEIARIMGLSHRSIEFYIEILKKKFSCRTKAQLISKAYALGFIK